MMMREKQTTKNKKYICNIIRVFLGISTSVLCWLCLSVISDRMPFLFRLGGCVICILRFVFFKKVNALYYDKRIINWVIRIIVAVYSSYAFGGVYLLDATGEYHFFCGKIGFAVILFLCSWLIVDFVLYALLTMNNQEKTIKCYWRSFIIIFSGGLFISIIYLIAWNPAITSYDSQYIYELALKFGTNEFEMTDWQPPGYVFFIGLLLKICNNIIFLMILQMIFYWLVVSKCILFFYRKGAPNWLLILSYVYMVFAYSNQIQIVTFWKDVPYSTALLLLTVLIIQAEKEWDKVKKSWSYYLQLAFAYFIVCFFRQNGIIPVMVLIFVIPVLFRSRIITLLSIVSFICIIIIKGAVFTHYNVIPQPSFKYYAMANDMLNASLSIDELDEDTQELIERMKKADPDDNLLINNVFYNHYVHADLSDYSIGNFIFLYLKNFIEHPAEMTRAVLRRTEIIWSVTGCEAEVLSCVDYTGEENNYSPPLYAKRVENKLTKIFDEAHRVIRNINSRIYVLFWRPGIYHVLILISMASVVIGKKRVRYRLVAFIPIILNVLSLAISSGWPDYRYYWPGIQVCWVLLSYCFISNSTFKNCKSGNDELDP